MKYWREYRGHKPEIKGTRKKVDNTIYSFDIETSSYLLFENKVYPALDYLKFSKEQRQHIIQQSNMYIWMLGINTEVYFGRTWEEFKEFLELIEENCAVNKYIFVHNLAFEFQYLKEVLKIETVFARKSHKVMKFKCADYNIEFRCTYFMSNAALSQLPKLFKLPVQKKVGDLDYSKLRHSGTPLTSKELGYCEYDCLVVYYYIKSELETYERIDKIPITSTGHVRRELKERIQRDYNYLNKVKRAVNTDPHIYNLLCKAFAGGYTHANWIYVDEVLEDIDSWDFTSSYPYVMVTHKFPMSKFRHCNVTRLEELDPALAYIVTVKIKDAHCKYYNNFISKSKCDYLKGVSYDNGRIMSADELQITLTDVDFRFIMDTYDYSEYEIVECYYSRYGYLPTQFIEFILEKYVNKTQFKNVDGKELEYSKEKNKFNALYGMCVTNDIRDEVEFINGEWAEIPISNEKIIEDLLKQESRPFLSFAWGCWVTAYARNNLLRNVIKLDEYVVYCDTDSIKLLPGYDKTIIENYNNFCLKKIKTVSEKLKIDIEKYSPEDCFGERHPLGVFDCDGHYKQFITQGAKKYCYIKYKNKYGFKQDFEFKVENKIEITVAGVPKSGAACVKCIEDFRDDLIFDYEHTNKNLIFYCDKQIKINLTDYLGKAETVTDKAGCCICPTTYILGKAQDFAELLEDSSKRAIFRERSIT